MTKCKVIVAEDSPCFLQGISTWLQDHKHFTLCHKLAGWTELQEMTNDQHKVILVTSLFWINLVPGFPAFMDYLKVHRQVHVMCFIRIPDELSMTELLTSGINSIIDGTATRDEFLFGLQEICDGRLYVTSRLPDILSESQVAYNKKNKHEFILTPREVDVLKLICLGFTDKEIGNKLSISKRTVDGYRANLLSKFGTKNSALMVKLALENQLV